MSIETKSVISRATEIYATRLRRDLLIRHMNRFVAIEPEFGDYSVRDTFDEAVESARTK